MKYWKNRKYREKALALMIALAMVLSLFPGLGGSALATETAVMEAGSAAVAAAPTFDTDLSAGPVTYIIGESANPLEVAASVTNGGEITYQWYSNSENSTEGGTEISGATETSYTPSTTTAGTTYYYVVVTNTLGESTATATSNVACVIIEAGGHTFTVEEGVLTAYSGPGGAIAIPDGVTAIASAVFRDNTAITSVTMPAGLKSIDYDAFYGCSALEAVALPDGLESIGAWAFYNCAALEMVNLPGSLTSLGGFSFNGCKLETIEVPSSIKTLDGAFTFCASLKTVVLHSGLTSINGAFQGCTALEDITLPDTLESIGSDSFKGCASLKSINFPESLTTVGKASGHQSISTGAFEGSGLVEVEFPNVPMSFGNVAFRDCADLTKVTLSGDGSVGNRGAGLFPGCTKLKEIVFPEGITEIWDYAYSGAPGIESMVVPETVTKIGEGAFAYMSGLKSVTLHDGIESIGTSAFSGSALESFTFPYNEKIVEIPGSMLYGTNITEIEIPDRITKIGNSAFASTQIAEIEIPDSVTEIGDSAFANTKLKELTIPASVVKINGAFAHDCTELENIIWQGDTVEITSAIRFTNCAKLKTLEFPNPTGTPTLYGSTRSGGAFFGCTSLKEFTIPACVTSIANYAFNGATVEKVTILSKSTTIGNNNAISAVRDITTFYIPRGSSGTNSLQNRIVKAGYMYKYIDAGVQATAQGDSGLAFSGAGLPVACYSASQYGFSKSAYFGEITALDVLAAAHEAKYGWENKTPGGQLAVDETGALTKAFGSDVSQYGFSVNGVEKSFDELGSTVVEDGDKIHFFSKAGKTFAWFEHGGLARTGITIKPGTEYELTLVSEVGAVKNVPIYLAYLDGTAWTPVSQDNYMTDDSGVIKLNFTENGHYILTPYSETGGVVFNFLYVMVYGSSNGIQMADPIGSPAFNPDTTLVSGYPEGTLVQLGDNGTPVGTGFDLEHTKYRLYANSGTTGITLQLALTEGTPADDLTLSAAFNGANVAGFENIKADGSSGKFNDLTLSLTTAESTLVLTVSCEEEGETFTRLYEIAIIREAVAGGTGTWEGEGTAEDPYRIIDINDLYLLRNKVGDGDTFEGKVFLMTADIELPAGWIPVGTLRSGLPSSDGVNILPFSGVFDGGGHTITIAKGGLPLFNYVREAHIRNLNIYGEQIAGTALINTYTVDYGPDGDYNTGTGGSYVPGCPDTVDIDNVTLKAGSSTLKSGFIGGYASGGNTVNISNSTIQSGVVIGYDKSLTGIGSFAGDFNGTITNCTSAATVYGVSYVGGIMGGKGQSMGPCSVTDSAFLGTVVSTGNYVGGIIGGGYSAPSAPNSPCVSVQNCYVPGSITGANGVGGILGGEPGVVQCWANGIGYIQNNYFSGTLTATADGAYSGGIIGYMKSLDRYNIIENNYYLSTSADTGIGQIDAIDYTTPSYGRSEPFIAEEVCVPTTAEEFASGRVAALLNRGNNSSGTWTQSGSYPVSGTAATATHTATLSTTGSGTAALTGLTTDSAAVYQNAGGTVTVSATAADGYDLAQIRVVYADGTTTDITDSKEFNMPQQNATVYVVFTAAGERYVDSIAIATLPAKTSYNIGDSFDGTGLTFTVTYNDGSTETLSVTSDMITGFSSASAGTKTLTLTYLGSVTTFTVGVVSSEEPVSGQVHVIVENTTYPESAGATWEGVLVDTWVDIDEESTMMSAVTAALSTVQATVVGAESNYITSINGLAASAGGDDSGWMGTLNDWFTNTGFRDVTVISGAMEPGDEIRVMYTTNLGGDLGGTWDNNDKTLQAIAFSTGTLSPAFDQDTHAYTLTVPAGTEGAMVTPTATNKNFQVRAYLGSQDTGTEYRRTRTIPISDGALISVVCGDPSWPSMNNQSGGTGAGVPAETYTITVQFEEEPVTGYTVGLTTADSDKNPGDTVTVDLNVDGTAGSYAALQTVVGYDQSRMSYTNNTFGESFTVTDNPSAGKLLITRVGASTVTGNQGSLTFAVKNDISVGSGETVFTVLSALVGVSGDPNDPEAAATGNDASVSLHNLTVTFTAGPNVTMDTITAYTRYGIAGLYTDNFYTTAFSEPIPTADSGYVLDSPIWHDGSGQVAYDTIAATAFTANAVYTATATQDLGVNLTLPQQVTVISGVTGGKAAYGTDVVFRVTPGPGQEVESVTYTVGTGNPVILTESEGEYTIPGTELTADVVVTVNQQLSGTVEFISFDDYKGAPTGFKVLKFDGSAPEGYKYQYNGANMYYSEKYQLHVCFAAADVTAETAVNAITCVEGTAPAVNYDGNVNQSVSGLNIIDAQLVYDLYTAVYLNDPAFGTISQLMRFAADMDGNGCTDTTDVQIIVNLVQSQEV